MEDLEFGYGSHGKPFLKNGALEFNLSHTGNLAVIALGPRHLGVDVESLESPGPDNRPWRLLARRYFSNPEKEYLLSLKEAEQPAAFLKIFTLKEATVKASGEGLAAGFPSFSVPLPLAEKTSSGRLEYFSKGIGPHRACLALAVENPDRAQLAYPIREWRQEDFQRRLEDPIPGRPKDFAVAV